MCEGQRRWRLVKRREPGIQGPCVQHCHSGMRSSAVETRVALKLNISQYALYLIHFLLKGDIFKRREIWNNTERLWILHPNCLLPIPWQHICIWSNRPCSQDAASPYWGELYLGKDCGAQSWGEAGTGCPPPLIIFMSICYFFTSSSPSTVITFIPIKDKSSLSFSHSVSYQSLLIDRSPFVFMERVGPINSLHVHFMP